VNQLLRRATSIVKKEGEKPISLDDVESSIEDFVPKISALQNQAELLRSNELKQVISTMKTLRKTELRGVFSEVDQLLVALVDAIDSLRTSAQSIRKSELRQTFEQMDQDAKSWVGQREREAVEALTGYNRQEAVETMMEVHVVGLSHHKAPVEVREKLAVQEPNWNAFAQELLEFGRTPQGYVLSEVAVLSTCNRFELYFASPELKKFAAVECVQAFLRKKSGLGREGLDEFLFNYSGDQATEHLFEVSSGLDSLVLGEAQILAQVKACHEHCIEKECNEEGKEVIAGSGGKIVSKMLNAGIRMGKLVRTRTKIGKGSVSVSSAAVELFMSRCMRDLSKQAVNAKVCVLGAGKMSRLLALALFSKFPDADFTVVNRRVEAAEEMLADDLVKARGGKNAKVAPMDQMWDVIANSDVVFTATGAKDPIITGADIERLGKKIMLVDIAVPLNVAADCADVKDCASYNVDDLKELQQANAAKRQKEVLKAKRLIGDEVGKFKLWKASQGAVPYLAALQAMAEKIRRNETDKMARKLQGLHEKEREAVDKLTRHIIDQIFRPVYYSMKDDEDVEVKKNKILALKNMFRLEPVYKRGMLAAPDKPKELPAGRAQLPA
jgi:glutamyl-tRNA reductase